MVTFCLTLFQRNGGRFLEMLSIHFLICYVKLCIVVSTCINDIPKQTKVLGRQGRNFTLKKVVQHDITFCCATHLLSNQCNITKYVESNKPKNSQYI